MRESYNISFMPITLFLLCYSDEKISRHTNYVSVHLRRIGGDDTRALLW